MPPLSNTPRLIKGGIVLIDIETSVIQRIIVLQYNPHTLNRTLKVQGVGAESGDRSEAMRLKGPPVETLKLDAEIDATDQPIMGKASTSQSGIHPQLAALETIIYPSSHELYKNNRQAQSGVLEITPMEAPLMLFIWSKNRILPVRLTDFSITEEAFDPSLNPIRAKVSLGMRVLTIDDLGFDHKGGSLYMAHHIQKETFARNTDNQKIISKLSMLDIKDIL